ncbi:hypothetical protein QBC34DRAFT_403901 [Podospora aff. communis PSN243]|uniref:Uncharacterized protein n=1 Tax=Podospora aff. communis PSN243 TaxID=3040156 RepID=A0AAV9GPX4_9PEZI|nr:hypothetical protein QBC34DRAFT_403901 [Podospora aff. communis PSN243]
MEFLRPRTTQVARQITARGGWPQGNMGSNVCPADVPVPCDPRIPWLHRNCCLAGQFCRQTWFRMYCCPTEDDCGSTVINNPRCINETWTMYRLTKIVEGYFCCPKEYVGVIPVEGDAGLCEPSAEGLPKSRLASMVLPQTILGTNPTATATVTDPSQSEATKSAAGGTTQGANSSGGNGGGLGLGESSSQNSSPSAGVIAGIVIGAAIILVAGFALVLWLHRRSLRGSEPPPEPAKSPEQEVAQLQQPPAISEFPSPTTPGAPNGPPPVYLPQRMSTERPEVDGVGRMEMPAD